MIDYLSTLYQFFSGKEFVIPLWEFVVYVAVTSVFLLLGKHRAGLIIAYCGIFYWAFILNYHYFLNMLKNTSYGFILYVMLGCIMIVMTVVGFLREQKNN